jgi:hypothetical protein
MYKPLHQAGPSHAIGLHLLHYRRNISQVMVRLPRTVMSTTGWTVGDRVKIEYDEHHERLRLTRCRKGEFKIGGKGKSRSGDQAEGRVRYVAHEGRPTLRETFVTEKWTHRSTDDAIIINVKDKMEINA